MLHSALFGVVLLLQGPGGFPTKHIGTKPTPAKVVAKVNGVDIKASDLEPFLWDWRTREVLDELISYKLVSDEAERLGVKVEDSAIESQIQRQMDMYKSQLPPGRTVDEALAEQGFSKSRIYMITKREMLLDALTLREFSPKGFYNVSTILIQPGDETMESLTAAIDLANKAHARLVAGEKWDKVLTTTIRDPKHASNNGLIGWRQASAFPAGTQKELEGMKPGQFTKPVQTQAGIQIFLINARGDTTSAEELEELKKLFVQAGRQTILQKLQTEAKIERFIGR